MKTNAKKLLLATAVSAGLVSGALITQAKATTLELDATAQARAAIELTQTQVIDFGIVDYLSTNTGTVTLGTDGAVAGGTDVTFDGTPAAGSVTVVGDGTSTVDVACDATGVLSDGAGNTINLTAVEVAVGTGVATGAGSACVDTSTTSTTMDLTTDTTLLVGASLDLTTTPIGAGTDGVYSATNAGGTTITLAVTYQ